jgi:molybdate transport repressor ModE-like protein
MTSPGFELWIDYREYPVFGSDKWKLLDAIHREGSLRAAADAMGTSYRKAWGDLRKAEQALGITFLERHRGGSKGGESSLTEEGRKWVEEFARFHREVEASVQKAFADWQKRMEE